MTTVTFSERAGATFASTQDAQLQAGSPTTNFKDATDAVDAVVRWALSNLPAGVIVSDAVINFNITTGDTGSWIFRIRQLLEAWVEDQVTWNEFSTGNAWNVAGGQGDLVDRSGIAAALLNYPGGFASGAMDSTSNTELIAVIQGFVDGIYSNEGLLINGIVPLFGLSANATDANRIQLTVTYNQAPTINVQPANLALPTVGATANFSISATTSGGTLHYQWKKNGNNIGTDSSTLAFATTILDQNARITCIVSDDNGSRTSSVALLTMILPMERDLRSSLSVEGSFPNSGLYEARSWFVNANGASQVPLKWFAEEFDEATAAAAGFFGRYYYDMIGQSHNV